MLVASAVALLVSFILSAETLQMARNPNQALSCDVNAKLSCTTVAQAWQSEIVKFGEMSFPNAFFGIAAESVFVTIAVIGSPACACPHGSPHAHGWAAWLRSPIHIGSRRSRCL